MRWVSSDPAGTVDGLNLFCMVRNNPVTLRDLDGRMHQQDEPLDYSMNTLMLQAVQESDAVNQNIMMPTFDDTRQPVSADIPPVDYPEAGPSTDRPQKRSKINLARLKCSTCDQQCYTYRQLNRHRGLVHDRTLFKCTFSGCRRLFKSQAELDSHKKGHDKNTFFCPVADCGHGFTESASLRKHNKEVHRKELFRCNYLECVYTFTRENALNRHKKTFTGLPSNFDVMTATYSFQDR